MCSNRDRRRIRRIEPSVEFERKQQIRQLRTSIRTHWRIPKAARELEVVKIGVAILVGDRTHRYDPRSGGSLERR